MTNPEKRALRLYRILLRLFPPRFQEQRGHELERLFLDMRRARRDAGRSLGPGFWLPLAWDTVSHALDERLDRSPRTPDTADITSRHRTRTMKTTMNELGSDLRFAARSAARQPLYAVMIVLMMTLGIAGNTAVFQVFNGLFLQPLPFPESERLVDLDVRAPRWNLDHVGVAYADFHAWRADNRSFESMGVFDVEGANYADGGEADRVTVVMGTHDLPGVLGLEPVLGRFFSAAEDSPGGPDVALVSQSFWQDRFGGSPDVLGRTANLNGIAYEIVGVLPTSASFVAEAEVWVPLREDPTQHNSFYLSGVGRLKPDVTPEAAVEDLTRIHKGLVDQWSVNRGTFPVVESLRDRYLGETRLGAGVLLAAVAVVLLIACANIAGLMVARSMERTREIGIRRAMGAPRGRIVRQLLTESLALAAVGAALGAWLGVQGSEVLVRIMEGQFPTWVTFALDWRFILFTVGATVGAAVLFGLAPALQTSRVDAAEALNATSGRSTASGGRRRAMGALVTGEVALALVLLVAGGLTVRDLQQLQQVDPGVRTEGVLAYRVELPSLRYPDDDAQVAFWQSHMERVGSLPGVQGVAATTLLPLSGQHSGWFFTVEDAPPRADDEANPVVLNQSVSPGFLEVAGVELLSGRGFNAFDGREAENLSAVVNESFVREFLPHRSDPLGARIRPGGEQNPWMTVVGVTRDTKHYGLDQEMRPAVYQPLRQMPDETLNVMVRTAGDPGASTGAVRAALRGQDPQLAMYAVTTMSELLDDSLLMRRASSWLIGAFSAVALLLAVAGLYGVISYTVSQRVQEIGIRMALGADQGQVLRKVLAQGMTLVAVGVTLGIGGALAVAGVVSRGLATGVSPTDPLVYAVVTGLLVVVAAVANLLPARRAAALEPMGVLRSE